MLNVSCGGFETTQWVRGHKPDDLSLTPESYGGRRANS